MGDVIGKDFVKIKTKELVNLRDLAAEYDIQEANLIEFHNTHCEIFELLPKTLPKYVEFIYIPIENYEKRQAKLIASNKLILPTKSDANVYGVILKFEPKNLQIHYKIRVKRDGSNVELKKEKTYINNKEAEKIIEQLFEKAEKALYPLQVSIGKVGNMEKVLNEKELTKRWKEDYAPKIKEYYQSEVTDGIIKQFDKVYDDINRSKDLFERNLFYKLFFLPIFRSYQNFEYEVQTGFYFSSLNQEFIYDIKCSLDKEYTRGGKIALYLNGNEEENIFNKNREKGKLDLLYKFEKETHEIFSITGKISAFEKEQENVIDFQLYKLDKS